MKQSIDKTIKLYQKFFKKQKELSSILEEIECNIKSLRPDFEEFSVNYFDSDGILCVMPDGDDYYEANDTGISLTKFIKIFSENPQITAEDICDKCTY